MGPQRWQSLCITRRAPRANQVQRGQDLPTLPRVLRPRGRREPRAQLRAGAVARARARRATRMPNAPSWHCLSWHCPSWHCLSPPRASHAPGRTPPRVASPPLGLGRCAHSAAEGLACPDTSRSLRPPRPKRAHADGVSRLYRWSCAPRTTSDTTYGPTSTSRSASRCGTGSSAPGLLPREGLSSTRRPLPCLECARLPELPPPPAVSHP